MREFSSLRILPEFCFWNVSIILRYAKNRGYLTRYIGYLLSMLSLDLLRCRRLNTAFTQTSVSECADLGNGRHEYPYVMSFFSECIFSGKETRQVTHLSICKRSGGIFLY